MIARLRFPKEIGWRDQLLGASLAILYVTWLLATARSLGFPRDEGVYFRAAADYARWISSFIEHPGLAAKRGAVDSVWAENHEHPSLMKILFALSWLGLHEKWHLFHDASTALRLPGMAMGGMACWVIYLFGARAYSRRAGIVAAVSFALMPRVFFHAHLACFDVPITAMWLLCIYCYWRAQVKGGFVWPLLAAVVFGLTLDTKHNAWILPGVFLPHAILTALTRILGRTGRARFPASIFTMALIGPAVLVALWPWLWNDTLPRLKEWRDFHVNHEYYNIEFLGRNYFGPPSPPSYMPVMIAATVPTVTLLLFALGGVERIDYHLRRLIRLVRRRGVDDAEDDRQGVDLLFAGAFFAAIAPWFLPKFPIFGGTKHWMPAYPFLALFAGRGFDLVADAMARSLAKVSLRVRRIAEVGLVASVIVAPLAITIHSHPFGLATYVPVVGGTAGGADLGLNRQFWGYTTESAGPWLAENAPKNATVFIHDTAWDSWGRMEDEDRVRRDLRGVGSPSESQIALIQHELHMNEVEYQIWVAFGTDAPAYIVTHDGVPIVSIYKRP